MKQGKLYGVGVGPGDPELLTLKALHRIEESDVIAVPAADPRDSAAWQIAAGAYPEIDQKETLALAMPMVKEEQTLLASHLAAARRIEAVLDKGSDVCFLTLGDVTVYSTYIYLHRQVLEDGYEAEIVNGIPSFCAAAARLNTALVLRDEPLHILPATFCEAELPALLQLPGTKVLMKAGKTIGKVKEAIRVCGKQAVMVENCGMATERIYLSTEEIPDDSGYYGLIIVKEEEKR